MPENLFVILKTVPSSVRSFVKNIKGRSPGNTELKNKLKPFMVDCENNAGFEIIKIIIKKIIKEKTSPEKFLFMLKIKKFDFFNEIVFVILKYMLK